MAEALEPQCLSCKEKDLLVLACNSDIHHLCLQCLLLWLRSQANEFSYQCPLHNECQSDFDPDFVSDILIQITDNSQEITVENIQKLGVNSALKDNKTVSCPKCHFFWTEEDDLVELFTSCSACNTTFCVTCEHTLGPYRYLDHVCPSEGSKKQQTAHDVAEILTEASTFKCKNPNCEVSRVGTPITKQDGDCNVIKCKTCKTFYCYICSKNLGLKNIGAHEGFPHVNIFIPGAPMCWLFDEINFNRTTEEALQLRKLHRLSEYFMSLQISKRAKQELVSHCKDLLGDLCEHIVLEQKEKCTIL